MKTYRLPDNSPALVVKEEFVKADKEWKVTGYFTSSSFRNEVHYLYGTMKVENKEVTDSIVAMDYIQKGYTVEMETTRDLPSGKWEEVKFRYYTLRPTENIVPQKKKVMVDEATLFNQRWVPENTYEAGDFVEFIQRESGLSEIEDDSIVFFQTIDDAQHLLNPMQLNDVICTLGERRPIYARSKMTDFRRVHRFMAYEVVKNE